MAGFGAALLAILVSYTVFMRWVVGAPPHWAEELPQLVLVWMSLLAAVACTYRRSHLSAGLMPMIVSSVSAQRLITRVMDVLLLAMFLLLAKAGWDLAWLTMSQTTTALQIPAGVTYMAVPVGCIGMALMQVELLLAQEKRS
ncbi:TRAP C4-dicarboxylate transporter [Halomonas huangheensis]|nr:TRAP C4-dicarboxylate transporter [Halomonas huangheensis]